MHARGDKWEGRARVWGGWGLARGPTSSLALPLGTSPLPAPQLAKDTGAELGAQGQSWR